MTTALDIVCDRCKVPLIVHGTTMLGQCCDLDLELNDLFRAIIGKKLWWKGRGQ